MSFCILFDVEPGFRRRLQNKRSRGIESLWGGTALWTRKSLRRLHAEYRLFLPAVLFGKSQH